MINKTLEEYQRFLLSTNTSGTAYLRELLADILGHGGNYFDCT